MRTAPPGHCVSVNTMSRREAAQALVVPLTGPPWLSRQCKGSQVDLLPSSADSGDLKEDLRLAVANSPPLACT